MDQAYDDLRRQRALRLKATREADDRLISAIFGSAFLDSLGSSGPMPVKAKGPVPTEGASVHPSGK